MNNYQPSKKVFFVFIFIFILGVFLVVMLIMTFNNFYTILETTTRNRLIAGMFSSVFIVVIGGIGIILYFIAPNKLVRYINRLVR
jgi:hypothetical protein